MSATMSNALRLLDGLHNGVEACHDEEEMDFDLELVSESSADHLGLQSSFGSAQTPSPFTNATAGLESAGDLGSTQWKQTARDAVRAPAAMAWCGQGRPHHESSSKHGDKLDKDNRNTAREESKVKESSERHDGYLAEGRNHFPKPCSQKGDHFRDRQRVGREPEGSATIGSSNPCADMPTAARAGAIGRVPAREGSAVVSAVVSAGAGACTDSSSASTSTPKSSKSHRQQRQKAKRAITQLAAVDPLLATPSEFMQRLLVSVSDMMQVLARHYNAAQAAARFGVTSSESPLATLCAKPGLLYHEAHSLLIRHKWTLAEDLGCENPELDELLTALDPTEVSYVLASKGSTAFDGIVAFGTSAERFAELVQNAVSHHHDSAFEKREALILADSVSVVIAKWKITRLGLTLRNRQRSSTDLARQANSAQVNTHGDEEASGNAPISTQAARAFLKVIHTWIHDDSNVTRRDDVANALLRHLVGRWSRNPLADSSMAEEMKGLPTEVHAFAESMFLENTSHSPDLKPAPSGPPTRPRRSPRSAAKPAFSHSGDHHCSPRAGRPEVGATWATQELAKPNNGTIRMVQPEGTSESAGRTQPAGERSGSTSHHAHSPGGKAAALSSPRESTIKSASFLGRTRSFHTRTEEHTQVVIATSSPLPGCHSPNLAVDLKPPHHLPSISSPTSAKGKLPSLSGVPGSSLARPGSALAPNAVVGTSSPLSRQTAAGVSNRTSRTPGHHVQPGIGGLTACTGSSASPHSTAGFELNDSETRATASDSPVPMNAQHNASASNVSHERPTPLKTVASFIKPGGSIASPSRPAASHRDSPRKGMTATRSFRTTTHRASPGGNTRMFGRRPSPPTTPSHLTTTPPPVEEELAEETKRACADAARSAATDAANKAAHDAGSDAGRRAADEGLSEEEARRLGGVAGAEAGAVAGAKRGAAVGADVGLEAAGEPGRVQGAYIGASIGSRAGAFCGESTGAASAAMAYHHG